MVARESWVILVAGLLLRWTAAAYLEHVPLSIRRHPTACSWRRRTIVPCLILQILHLSWAYCTPTQTPPSATTHNGCQERVQTAKGNQWAAQLTASRRARNQNTEYVASLCRHQWARKRRVTSMDFRATQRNWLKSMLRFLSPSVKPERIKSYVHETERNKIMTSTAQIHLLIDKLVRRMQPDGSFGVQPACHCLTWGDNTCTRSTNCMGSMYAKPPITLDLPTVSDFVNIKAII